jgi:hypothetical protein
MGDSWRWCGYPHHFIGSRDCLFSMATFVGGGRWLVSTVGDYRPNGKRTPIGIDGEMFETMVFATDPSMMTDGEPTVIDWSELSCVRYMDSTSAVNGHMATCIEYEAGRG